MSAGKMSDIQVAAIRESIHLGRVLLSFKYPVKEFETPNGSLRKIVRKHHLTNIKINGEKINVSESTAISGVRYAIRGYHEKYKDIIPGEREFQGPIAEEEYQEWVHIHRSRSGTNNFQEFNKRRKQKLETQLVY